MRITACILSGMQLIAASCKKNEFLAENASPGTEKMKVSVEGMAPLIPPPDTYTSEDYW